ncbi:MAG: S49 family peptidase, partial [Phycisphaerales bacterium]|nr:S49 family peptidase [Phycisphaerales bacterium]
QSERINTAVLRLVSRAGSEPWMLRGVEFGLLMDLARVAVPNAEAGAEATAGARARAVGAQAGVYQQVARVESAVSGAGAAGGGGREYGLDNGIALIGIGGVLDKTDADVTDSLGNRFGTSYQSIVRQASAAMNDREVRGVLLVIDSPGGAAMSVQEAADAIVELRGKKPVGMLAYDMAASAALYIGGQATEGLVMATSGGWVGSIGTILMVHDYSEYLAKEGIKVTAIKSTPTKDVGSPYRAMTDEDQQILQAEVNRYDSLFVSALAGGRNVDEATVRRWQAGRGYVGQAGVDAGLVSMVVRDVAAAAAEVRRRAESSSGKAGSGGGAKAERVTGVQAASEMPDANNKERSMSVDVLAAERNRVATIEAKAQPFGKVAGVAELVSKAKGGDMSAEAFSVALLDLVAQASAPAGPSPEKGAGSHKANDAVPSLSIVADERDKFVEDQALSLLNRSGGRLAAVMAEKDVHDPGRNDRIAQQLGYATASDLTKAMGQAKARRRMVNLTDLARMCIARSKGISMDQVMSAYPVSDGTRFMAAAFHTTSDFPLILSNLANKTLLAAFAERGLVWRNICAVASANDYKPQNMYSLSEGGNLVQIPQGQTPSETTFNERAQSASVAPFGRRFSLTYQMLRNDDLNAFSSWAARLGMAAARVPEDLLFGLLALNSGNGPTMSDNIALFNAAHRNLGSAAALSYAAAQADYTAMRRQRGFGPDAAWIDVTPSTLLVPVELQWTAEDIATQEFIPDATANNSNIRNTLRNRFTPLATPRLTGTRRYWFGNPAEAPTFTMLFLDGNESPEIQQVDADSDPLNQRYQCTLFGVGIGANQWETAYSNPG